MHVDSYGLPVQADGDANDQLQRCGMIMAAHCLRNDFYEIEQWEVNCLVALDSGVFEHSPGVYVRHVGGDTNNVSADQLIAALAAHVAAGNIGQISAMFKACIKRFGFAQNVKDGLDAKNHRSKLPDFLFVRGLPLFTRAHWLLYPVSLLSDLLLVLQALAAVGPVFPDGSFLPHKRGPDDVDHNNTILTLAVCSHIRPTPLSWLARKLFGKFCPNNRGTALREKMDMPERLVKVFGPCNDYEVVTCNKFHPVYGSLRHYHRAEAGGNPEIAEMWKPICERYFE